MDNLKITIQKNGEIIVEFGTLEPVLIKKYIDLFEESLGPVKVIVNDDDPVPISVRISDLSRDKEEAEKRTKKRQKKNN